MHTVKTHWPLLGAVALLAATVVGSLLVFAQRLPGAPFTYALDDAYIHLSMARSLADHGVFGVTPDAFSSASSSPLWVLLLAGLRRLGIGHEAVPLWLNLLAAAALLWTVDRLLRTALKPWPRFLFLGLLLAALPLCFLALTGMEHVLHALLSLLFLVTAARVLSREAAAGPGLLLLAALSTAARYEGLFAVAIVGLLLLGQRRLGLALLLGAAGLLPVVSFGLVSVANGSYFLPNSVLAKAQHPQGHGLAAALDFAGNWIGELRRKPSPLALLIACTALLVLQVRARRWTAATAFNVCAIGTTLQHAEFARLAVLYRYEAYLLVLMLAALAWGLPEWLAARPLGRRARGLLALGLLALAIPLGQRAWTVQRITPGAMVNIGMQQVQMGRFLGDYYAGETVAVNDIGAVAWYGHVRLLDLVGLASVDVLRARIGNHFDVAARERLADQHGVGVAVVYDLWFAGLGRPLPASWTRVARWRIPDNVACADDTVSFYATRPAEATRLDARLREFEPRLPAGVEVSYPRPVLR